MWNEPTEVAAKPPQYIFPLAICQHISPSLIPADNEWSFVINFETVAIRFSCNSRETMLEWVDCIRFKLGEMGILNPKGNLYSKVPQGPPAKIVRNPMSPLPSPPDVPPHEIVQEIEGNGRNRHSIVDASDESNQTFTTSIYLNQTPPATPQVNGGGAAAAANSSSVATTTANSESLGARPKTSTAQGMIRPSSPSNSVASISTNKSYETLPPPKTPPPPSTSQAPATSVYLNKSGPTRHVTVIPINSVEGAAAESDEHPQQSPPKSSGPFSESKSRQRSGETGARPRNKSPSRRQRSPTDLVLRSRASRQQQHYPQEPTSPAKITGGGVFRRFSDRRHNDSGAGGVGNNKGYNIQQRIRKRTQRSSSLGPLLDEHVSLAASRSANTNSLESIDSNPRQAVPRHTSKYHHHHHHHQHHQQQQQQASSATGTAATVQQQQQQHRRPSQLGGTVEPSGDPALRGGPHPVGPPPPYHPPTGIPPHIPLPGLTCQLSLSLPPGMSALPSSSESLHQQQPQRSLREQQVIRLRQEIAHPAGVRLTLRKRDCHNSLALVEFFGCLWVAGWKQRDFPVLYNAFHIGDQIVSVSGQPIKTASEFSKLTKVKPPPSELHVEIIIRRTPFAQVFHLRREVDAQPLGIVTVGNTSEIREILPGSPASTHGMTSKIRSFDGQGLVAWTITEVNGRPLNLFGKDGEAGDRLQSVGRDISVLVQPSDVVGKMRKHLKSFRGHKEYILS